MECSHLPKRLSLLALLSAVVLTSLRVFHLKNSLDSDGLLPPQSKVLLITVLACAGFFLALMVLCLKLNRLPGTESCFSQGGVWGLPKLVAAALLLAGSVLLLQDQELLADSRKCGVTIAGAVSALAMGWSVYASKHGAGLFWLRLLPALFTVAGLILRFRIWSHDPLIIHIVPFLLAWVCCTMETMLLTGFPLGAGHRRSTVLFGLSAGMFSCMSIADYLVGQKTGSGEALTLLGLAIWSVCAALELLQPRVQEEQPANDETQNPGEEAVPHSDEDSAETPL
ncbi:MAG: hypothetical protein IIY70_04840 [Oscillospiraceae bacterium]|nr:hypothetical protein [Oscillospiraceae bacterium]